MQAIYANNTSSCCCGASELTTATGADGSPSVFAGGRLSPCVRNGVCNR
jgi:hypothetical protein